MNEITKTVDYFIATESNTSVLWKLLTSMEARFQHRKKEKQLPSPSQSFQLNFDLRRNMYLSLFIISSTLLNVPVLLAAKQTKSMLLPKPCLYSSKYTSCICCQLVLSEHKTFLHKSPIHVGSCKFQLGLMMSVLEQKLLSWSAPSQPLMVENWLHYGQWHWCSSSSKIKAWAYAVSKLFLNILTSFL